MRCQRKSGRPEHCRRVGLSLGAAEFVPLGVVRGEPVELGLDELEAIRLMDLEGLYQEQAARQMEVSRQTLGRILKAGRTKIADALLHSRSIQIQGGKVRHQHLNRHGGQQGFCICPKCEQRFAHEAGVPCQETTCRHCGVKLLREGSDHHEQWLKRKNKP